MRFFSAEGTTNGEEPIDLGRADSYLLFLTKSPSLYAQNPSQSIHFGRKLAAYPHLKYSISPTNVYHSCVTQSHPNGVKKWASPQFDFGHEYDPWAEAHLQFAMEELVQWLIHVRCDWRPQ